MSPHKKRLLTEFTQHSTSVCYCDFFPDEKLVLSIDEHCVMVRATPSLASQRVNALIKFFSRSLSHNYLSSLSSFMEVNIQNSRTHCILRRKSIRGHSLL